MPRTSRSLGVLLLVMATATAAVPDLAQLKIAAERGDPVAQFEYARKISLSNPKEQFGWFLKSAQQGYALAQDAVAARLDNEFDPKKKPTAHREAARWASRAAFQELASAQAKLGRYYDRSIGVPKNPVTGYMWLQIAVLSTGGEKAIASMGYRAERNQMIARITSEQIAEGQRLADQFRLREFRGGINAVEADIIFGQLKLTAAYEVAGQKSAVVNNVRFTVGETKDISIDANPLRFKCAAVDAKSARFTLVGTDYEAPLSLKR